MARKKKFGAAKPELEHVHSPAGDEPAPATADVADSPVADLNGGAEVGEVEEEGESAGRAKELPRCPNCGWRNVRLSHSNGPVDAVMKMFSVVPFRCRSCGTRFRRRWVAEGPNEDKPEKPEE